MLRKEDVSNAKSGRLLGFCEVDGEAFRDDSARPARESDPVGLERRSEKTWLH